MAPKVNLRLVALAWAFWLVPAITTQPSLAGSDDTVRVLWRDPGDLASRDLTWGAGSADRQPKPPFTFVSEDVSGTKPKIDITDAAGTRWSVKFTAPMAAQNEVHADIAASRLVWALGYFADEHYFVPEGRIEGVKQLKRAASAVASDGTFKVARFERRSTDVQAISNWDIEKNPFAKSRELAGLHMLMMLISSWDVLPPNLAVVRVTLPDGNKEERYVLTDLGSTFGRMRGGANTAPSRWNLHDYVDSRLLSGVAGGRLVFRGPLMGNAPLGIPVDQARWFVGLLSQLSERQIRQLFEAAGASTGEVEGFSGELIRRIGEMKAALKL